MPRQANLEERFRVKTRKTQGEGQRKKNDDVQTTTVRFGLLEDPHKTIAANIEAAVVQMGTGEEGRTGRATLMRAVLGAVFGDTPIGELMRLALEASGTESFLMVDVPALRKRPATEIDQESVEAEAEELQATLVEELDAVIAQAKLCMEQIVIPEPSDTVEADNDDDEDDNDDDPDIVPDDEDFC